jgi:hypothetical protein
VFERLTMARQATKPIQHYGLLMNDSLYKQINEAFNCGRFTLEITEDQSSFELNQIYGFERYVESFVGVPFAVGRIVRVMSRGIGQIDAYLFTDGKLYQWLPNYAWHDCREMRASVVDQLKKALAGIEVV